jgi:short-subunit dehydrogenase
MMKVCIVTGASSGIGLAIATHLAQKGHHVYGISRSKYSDKLVKHIQADVTDFNQIQKAYKEIYDIEGRIDVLINNAGMGISGSVEDTLPEDVTKMFDVNFMGVFHSVKAALPWMREQKSGHIYNISSVAGVLSIPFQSFYSASKAALIAFSDALHTEVSPLGIQVCTLLPGDIKTGFTKNRKKNVEDSFFYKSRVEKSVQLMEKDEQNGMDPLIMATTLAKMIQKKRIPLLYTVGFKYQIFVCLKRWLPTRWVNHLIGSVYGFKKDK